jgi:hypothetical protein
MVSGFRQNGGEWAHSGWALILILFAFELLLYIEQGENHQIPEAPPNGHFQSH